MIIMDYSWKAVVLEETLASPLDCKEIKPVLNFIERTDADAEALILWPPDEKSWLIRKDPDAEKDWRQEEKGMTEDRMVGWHHWLNGQEFEQPPRDGERQRSLVCCSPWGHEDSDTRVHWITTTVERIARCRFSEEEFLDNFTIYSTEQRQQWKLQRNLMPQTLIANMGYILVRLI